MGSFWVPLLVLVIIVAILATTLPSLIQNPLALAGIVPAIALAIPVCLGLDVGASERYTKDIKIREIFQTEPVPGIPVN